MAEDLDYPESEDKFLYGDSGEAYEDDTAIGDLGGVAEDEILGIPGMDDIPFGEDDVDVPDATFIEPAAMETKEVAVEDQSKVEIVVDEAPVPTETVTMETPTVVDSVEKDIKEEPVEEGNKEEEEDDSDDSDDDDDVQITLNPVEASTTTLPISQQATADKTISTVNAPIKQPATLELKPRQIATGNGGPMANKAPALDVNGQGDINGVPTMDYDLDDHEEKPWRKPGADLTDYFNYGFNEEIWKAYTERERHMRNEAQITKKHHRDSPRRDEARSAGRDRDRDRERRRDRRRGVHKDDGPQPPMNQSQPPMQDQDGFGNRLQPPMQQGPPPGFDGPFDRPTSPNMGMMNPNMGMPPNFQGQWDGPPPDGGMIPPMGPDGFGMNMNQGGPGPNFGPGMGRNLGGPGRGNWMGGGSPDNRNFMGRGGNPNGPGGPQGLYYQGDNGQGGNQWNDSKPMPRGPPSPTPSDNSNRLANRDERVNRDSREDKKDKEKEREMDDKKKDRRRDRDRDRDRKNDRNERERSESRSKDRSRDDRHEGSRGKRRHSEEEEEKKRRR